MTARTHPRHRTHLAAMIAGLIGLGAVASLAQGPGTITWQPGSSTYDGKAFVELQPGIGATQLGFPGATNPAGAGLNLGPAYAFGFATGIPGADGPTMAQTDLGASPLKAGTRLVLRFSKAANDHVSFVAMLADASDLGNIGVKVLSPTELEVRATIVDPIASEHNSPDAITASFGLIMQTTDSPDETFNFRGTTFVTNMHWLDLEPLALTELPQLSPDVDIAGFAAGIAARGVSSVVGNRGDFTAYMPEALFAFARANGVEVTGEECLGYRAYVELTGGEEGFLRLNDPPSLPEDDANFDVDGDGAPDPMWRFRISNSQWSRQPILFGTVQESPPVPTAVGEASWGDLKGAVR
ncbi:MAG: hypothetical protein ABIL09_18215 [Gemmatimonadota bacterium]